MTKLLKGVINMINNMNKYAVTLTQERIVGEVSHLMEFSLMVKGYSDQQVRDMFSCGGYVLTSVKLFSKRGN